MPADSDRDRLPFEPTKKRKKSEKSQPAPISQDADSSGTSAQSGRRSPRRSQDDNSIPEAVSRRMLRRMLFFSGIPVSLGVLIFFASYVVITQHIAELPNVAVLLTTLGCFGLSVVGLSYGALSASWDEKSVGSILGIDQFKLNFGRLLDSWRQAREQRQNNS